MRVRRLIRYPITLLFAFIALTCCAQSSSWLKRSWEGKAYTLGADPQRYDLILNIASIKGKNFEGVIKAVEPADTSNHFDTKITGVIFDKYLRVNIGPWKAKCGTCKPQVLEFSMESGRFFMKGEAKGCSTVECTWITEFSEPLIAFNTKDQDILFTMADEIKAPEPETQPAIENTAPPKDTVAIVKQETHAPSRIILLPAGNIVTKEKNTSLFAMQKPRLWRNASFITVAQTTPPPPRVIVLPAGDIVVEEHKNVFALQKPPANLNRSLWMTIPETTPEPPRVDVLPAGDIAMSQHNNSTQTSLDLSQKNISLTVDETTPPPPRINMLPADVTLVPHNPQRPLNKPPYPLPVKKLSLQVKQNVVASVQKPPPPKDTAVSLPSDYAERKKNVIRTLIVNTDSITLRVYDNGVVDGDIVSVIYNDKVVVDKLSLTQRAVVVKIPVKKSGVNTLVFHAHNLGEYPPNTALLEILYGNKYEELTVSSDLTVSSTIDIEYQQ